MKYLTTLSILLIIVSSALITTLALRKIKDTKKDYKECRITYRNNAINVKFKARRNSKHIDKLLFVYLTEENLQQLNLLESKEKDSSLLSVLNLLKEKNSYGKHYMDINSFSRVVYKQYQTQQVVYAFKSDLNSFIKIEFFDFSKEKPKEALNTKSGATIKKKKINFH